MTSCLPTTAQSGGNKKKEVSLLASSAGGGALNPILSLQSDTNITTLSPIIQTFKQLIHNTPLNLLLCILLATCSGKCFLVACNGGVEHIGVEVGAGYAHEFVGCGGANNGIFLVEIVDGIARYDR